MLDVERWAELRREHFVRGVSIKELMRRTGLARNTIRVALRSEVPAKLAAVEGDRRALILFSDGQNNSSTHNMTDTIEAAQIADTRWRTVPIL